MPQVELTNLFVKNVKPEGRKTDYFDTTVRGLCLRVSAGGTKSWYLVYSKPDRSRAWLKLGTYDDIALKDARQKARDGRGEVGEGEDPIAKRQAEEEAASTVSELVEEYITRHASTKRTADAIARRLRKNVAEVIGKVRLADLHRREITKCINKVADRGAGIEANRVFEDLRAMLRWAKGRGAIDVDLVDGMPKPTKAVARKRVLSPSEIEEVWSALPNADMRESTRRILRLCLITGQRVGEVCGMTRAEIDLESRLWTIPEERVKNAREHEVPLSDMAVDIIKAQLAEADALAKRKGRDASEWVLPGPGARAPVTGHAVAKALKWAEVIGEDGAATIFGLPSFTTHDLRRSAATHMEGMGISPYVVGHCLNHASITRGSVTSRHYALHEYRNEKRKALDDWAERLAAMITGGAEIVPLRSLDKR